MPKPRASNRRHKSRDLFGKNLLFDPGNLHSRSRRINEPAGTQKEMFGIALPLLAGAAPVLPLLKAASELHHTFLTSDVLSRQGESVPSLPGLGDKLSRQRASGVRGNTSDDDGPSWLKKVPKKNVTGDLRKVYDVGARGNATSSQGNMEDILLKVPNKGSYGTEQYKRIARPEPRRSPGFGNQSFTP